MSIPEPEHESFAEAMDPNRVAKRKQNTRWLLIGGIISVVALLFVYTVMFRPAPGQVKPGAAPDKETAERITTASDVARLQPLSPSAQNTELKAENGDLQTNFTNAQSQIKAQQAEIEQMKLQATADQQHASEQLQQARMRTTPAMLPARESGALGDAASYSPMPGRASPTLSDHGQGEGAAASAPRPHRSLLVVGDDAPAGAVAPSGGTSAADQPQVLKTASKTSPAGGAVTDTVKVYDSREFVPPNSYVEAKVLVGVDMTTGVGGQSDPKPVLFRITDDAIGVGMTGRFQKSNLKGCLVNGAAYGELSSEKVYIKLQRITCPVGETEFMTAQVEGFAVHMGKAGVRGPVVSREGSLTSKALIAGLFQGLGQSLQQNVQREQQTVGTSSSGQQLLANTPLTTAQIEQASVGSGVANASNTLAEYLIKRAEQYQPVIEMQTGIQVELVFETGFKFKPGQAAAAPIGDAANDNADLSQIASARK